MKRTLKSPPTCVHIDFQDNSYTSFLTAGKLLELGYSVTSKNCPFEPIKSHIFFLPDCKGKYFWKVKTFEVSFDEYTFVQDPEISLIRFLDFVIGTWGTIRGNRYQYNTNCLKVDKRMLNEWSVNGFNGE